MHDIKFLHKQIKIIHFTMNTAYTIAIIIALILLVVWSQRSTYSTYPTYYNAAAPAAVPLNRCQQLAPSLRKQCEEATKNPVSWLGRV